MQKIQNFQLLFHSLEAPFILIFRSEKCMWLWGLLHKAHKLIKYAKCLVFFLW